MKLTTATYLALLTSLVPTLAQTNATYLTLPALVTIDNRTAIQCWRFTTPFKTSTVPGTIGAQSLTLANATNLSYTILPPRFNGGLHTAPRPQLVHFVSGLAHVTLPSGAAELWLVGGAGGVLVAADTTGEGHVTMYPSDQQTVGLLAPFEGGRVPAYEVLREGACEGEQSFL
ncbi:hypothetical protein C7974DRAFT_178065 [Boeremia exigua]|uniref:uncharacterized protein n=1 Tax=Boeremia exigua TaxID=749465 RepID=UPI001E8EE621|nr:uncharacterized protein C7974DRAFT_178065 [Boeremia exigua]KAH6633784.1 hypothetical protein C7974DRAFT_178065 [Boeremia exigua]